MILLAILLCAIDWRLGGMYGAPFRFFTAMIITWLCWDQFFPLFGWWSLLYVVWFGVGEHSGWKPKFAKDRGRWWKTAFSGLLMGGVGFLIVPLSTWIHRQVRYYPPMRWPRWLREFLEPAGQNELIAGALSVIITPVFWYYVLNIIN